MALGGVRSSCVTDATNAAAAARALVAHLVHGDATQPDVLVLELGDGLLGTYGVDAILGDACIRGAISHTILCAVDPVGVWGAVRALDERYGLATDLVSGPVTNSRAGTAFCRDTMRLPAWNALHGPSGLELEAGALSLPAEVTA